MNFFDRLKSRRKSKKKAKKKIPAKQRMRWRSYLVFAVIAVVFLATSVNLGVIQIVNGDYYKLKAEENQLHDTAIAAERGMIYDANGTVLAKSASVWRLYINTIQFSKIENEDFKNTLYRRVSEVTGIELEKVKEIILEKVQKDITIKEKIEFEEKERLVKLLNESYTYTVTKEVGKGKYEDEKKIIDFSSVLGLSPDLKRYYTFENLASTVIGFLNSDDIGEYGVESKYNTVLTGTPGRLITAENARRDVMSQEFQTIYDAVQGNGLVLTIDEVIQRYLEDALEQVYVDSKGVGAHGVVMDVNTGAILAMASLPNFDPNDPNYLTDDDESKLEETYPDEDEREDARKNLRYSRWRNFIVSDTYEPGSVFKIVTAAAALEENVYSPDAKFTCTGRIQVSDRIIQCHKRDGHGTQDLKQGLMNSCNPLFITVGQKLGKDKFFEYFEAFGFTEKTGIDLPAENLPVAGVNYHSLSKMGIVELSSSSFGQSFQVTPLQMITAISAIANGGKLMTPYVVDKQLDENGNVISQTEPTVRRQVVSEQTASMVADMMEAVVTSGTGKNAYVAGYRVAGKTGTSQKLGKKGEYVASFGCFAPADDPEIAVLILVDEPVGQINGGQICTPVAAQVVEKTLEYMGVERQYSEKELQLLDTNAPNIVGSSVKDAKAMLIEEGFEVKVVGNGETVLSQMPAYNQTMPQNGVIVLYTEKDAERVTVEVPDLRQMTVSQANKYALSAGLNIKISGNALNAGELISYDQSIEPGDEVEYGKTITVYFKSDVGVGDYAD